MNYLGASTLWAFSAILIVHLLAPLAVFGALFDDFNDNSTDPAKWKADRVSGPIGISLNEQNARLELIRASSNGTQAIIFHDSLMNLRYDETWQVTVDAYMLVDVNTEPSARVGLAVLSSGLSNVRAILLKADDGARRLQGYHGGLFGPDFWTRPPSELANNGDLIVSYSASTHLVSLAFANGIGVESPVTYGTLGIDGAAVGTLGTENWGMTNSDLFTISLIGTTAGTPVASGQAWFDNVQLVRQSPGDFNNDGKFDASDYVVWRKSGGTQAEYTSWRTHFGQTAGSASSANSSLQVPEPATLGMLMCAAAGWCLRRIRTPGAKWLFTAILRR